MKHNYLVEYNKIINDVCEEFSELTFDCCSNRLKKLLKKNKIFTIGQLKNIQYKELTKVKGLGPIAMQELIDFLLEIKNNPQFADNVIEPQPFYSDSYLLKNDFYDYKHDIHQKIGAIDVNQIEFSYYNNLEQFDAIYDLLINNIIIYAKAKLNEHRQQMLYKALGIYCNTKTNREIARDYNISVDKVKKYLSSFRQSLSYRRNNEVGFFSKKIEVIDAILEVSLVEFLAFLVIMEKSDELIRTLLTGYFCVDNFHLNTFKNKVRERFMLCLFIR